MAEQSYYWTGIDKKTGHLIMLTVQHGEFLSVAGFNEEGGKWWAFKGPAKQWAFTIEPSRGATLKAWATKEPTVADAAKKHGYTFPKEHQSKPSYEKLESQLASLTAENERLKAELLEWEGIANRKSHICDVVHEEVERLKKALDQAIIAGQISISHECEGHLIFASSPDKEEAVCPSSEMPQLANYLKTKEGGV